MFDDVSADAGSMTIDDETAREFGKVLRTQLCELAIETLAAVHPVSRYVAYDQALARPHDGLDDATLERARKVLGDERCRVIYVAERRRLRELRDDCAFRVVGNTS